MSSGSVARALFAKSKTVSETKDSELEMVSSRKGTCRRPRFVILRVEACS